jgi:hypothetical protein
VRVVGKILPATSMPHIADGSGVATLRTPSMAVPPGLRLEVAGFVDRVDGGLEIHDLVFRRLDDRRDRRQTDTDVVPTDTSRSRTVAGIRGLTAAEAAERRPVALRATVTGIPPGGCSSSRTRLAGSSSASRPARRRSRRETLWTSPE